MKPFNFKNDFPILNQEVYGKPLVFLDSGVTSQKPQCVMDAINYYYSNDNSNVHRGVYQLSERATVAYEKTRHKIKTMLNAVDAREIIFTSGTTESINLLAYSYGRSNFKAGDEVIISEMEHHSNIVPWQILKDEIGIQLKVIPISDDGEIDLVAYENLFSSHTKMVAIIHVSNVLGTVNPIKKMIEIAHQHEVPVLIDGAQAFPHIPVDVQDLDCDFYAFSAHKAYGPTGMGILYGKAHLLEKMPPYQTGGAMIETVSFEKTTYTKIPYKFEAGTPNIADVVSFHAALEYLDNIGMQQVMNHEHDLLTYAIEKLTDIPGIKVLGNPKERVGVISFVLEGVHPHDIGTILDREGIAIRAGHHCAMPLMQRFNIPACVRISFGLYNSRENVDALILGLQKVREVFA